MRKQDFHLESERHRNTARNAVEHKQSKIALKERGNALVLVFVLCVAMQERGSSPSEDKARPT